MKNLEIERALQNAARLLSAKKPDLNAVMIEINTALGLIQSVQPPRVIVTIEGGLPAGIHSSDPAANVAILNHDYSELKDERAELEAHSF